MISDDVIRKQLDHVISTTARHDLGERTEGKVRDSYVSEGQRILIVTDRVSAFDSVVGTIPFKGQVLNQLSNFWLQKTKGIAPNHLIFPLSPRSSAVRECNPIDAEFIVRAYITGSLWKCYAAGQRFYAGVDFPDGLTKHQRLKTLALTPSTKAPVGEHDLPSSAQKLIVDGSVTAPEWVKIREMCLDLFMAGISPFAALGASERLLDMVRCPEIAYGVVDNAILLKIEGK